MKLLFLVTRLGLVPALPPEPQVKNPWVRAPAYK